MLVVLLILLELILPGLILKLKFVLTEFQVTHYRTVKMNSWIFSGF